MANNQTFTLAPGEEITAERIVEMDIPTQKRGGYMISFVDTLLDEIAVKLKSQDGKLADIKASNYLNDAIDTDRGVEENEDISLVANDDSELPDTTTVEEEDTVEEDEPDKVEEPAVNTETEHVGNLFCEKELERAKRELEASEEFIGALQKEIEELKTKLVAKEDSINESDKPNVIAREATGILAGAQKVADETVAKAKREAENILVLARKAQDDAKNETEHELRSLRHEINRLKDRRAGFLMRVKGEVDSLSSDINVWLGADMPNGLEVSGDDDVEEEAVKIFDD